VAGTRIHSIADDLAFGYKPTRYDHIASSPASRNLLRNGSFDVWARSDQTWRNQPVWWEFTGSRDATLTTQRHDLVRATHNSVQLINPSTSASTFTQMSQVVTVTPETTYTLSAWARTACAPAGIEVRLEYRDAAGLSVTTKRVSGAAAAVGGSAFRQITTTVVAPRGAVRAVVTLRLAGGTTAISTTQTVSGTSAVFDEISLVRPQAKIGIKVSRSTSYIGKTVTVSGSVTPTAAVGNPTVVYVLTPGSSRWVAIARPKIYASGTAAAWRFAYHFRRGAHKGVYKFKAEVPAFAAYPGWLGSGMSSTVRVTLK
jgi:hypothetical protein